jgi:hypothetical protein
MVGNAYDAILDELALALKIKTLKADANNSCLITLQNGFQIQIEPDAKGENLIIGSNIGSIQSGPFRINVFKEALKANGLPPPKWGIFAWSRKSNQLVLFGLLPIRELTGSKVADFIYPFVAKAIKWRDAINSGQVPRVEFESAAGSAMRTGMFGLRP